MPRRPPPTGKLGVALLGLGSYSKGQLAPALQLTEHCRLAGIVTGSPEKIPVWQQKYGIPEANTYSYATMGGIADNDEIDVVYIVVPTSLHAKYAVAAAETGKHVWCEKPMAMTVAECDRIIDACNANNVRLCIGYRMQHEPNTRTVMEYAQSKPFGDIESVRAASGYAGSPPKTGWRADPAMGGGALYDMGVYAVNGLRYATGREPTAVVSARRVVPDRVDVTTEFQLRFPDGIRGDGFTSVVDDENRLRVTAERGWYQLSPMQAYNGVTGERSDGVQLDRPIQNQQARQMDDDALAIMQDRPVIAPGEEGRKDIRIIQAILEAERTGKEVKI